MTQDISTSVGRVKWGSVSGEEVWLFALKNKRGTTLYVSNFGATAQALFVADRNGLFSDVLLGYNRLEAYAADEYYMGSVVGRYANRIAGADVWIAGKKYRLPVREGKYHLHGGIQGFNKKVFKCSSGNDEILNSVLFTYTSSDMEEGFPGTLQLEVRYTLDDTDQWIVEYKAVSNKTTLINLTQHAYFNLTGNPVNLVTGHELEIYGSYYLPVNDLQVPTGSITDVAGTPFDFRSFKAIAKDISKNNEQLRLSCGYDHSFVLEKEHTSVLKHAAAVREPIFGRKLDVYTTEPAIHFYSGNFLHNVKGKNNILYAERSGLCLETQHFPDAPNHSNFPSTLLEAGEKFSSKTIYKFSVVLAP